MAQIRRGERMDGETRNGELAKVAHVAIAEEWWPRVLAKEQVEEQSLDLKPIVTTSLQKSGPLNLFYSGAR